MITVSDISKRYDNTVLDNISLAVYPGNICCLLGKNGAGKSTLINIIAGLTRPDSGEIIINERLLQSNTVFTSGEIGIVSQTDNIINQLTGHQFLVFQCLVFEIPKKVMEERIKSLSEYFFDNPVDLNKPASTYSSGMRMKLRIIAALINNPRILLLDEPFANLDPVAADKLVELLKKFNAKKNSIALISSHDLLYVDKIATQICVLNDTHIIFDGSKEEFTMNDTLKLDKTLLDLIKPKKSVTGELDWMI